MGKQPQLDERQLAQQIRAAALLRQTECWKKVMEVCEEYGCALVPQITLTGSQVASQIMVVDSPKGDIQ